MGQTASARAVSSKTALVIMGVGRSGTSALTRMLNLLGARLPAATLAANHGNEQGYWEPLSILALSDEILAVHGSNWFDPNPLPSGWFASAAAEPFIDRAKTVILEDFGGAPLIVIKEPRLCRLAPIYLAALDRAGYAARIVIPLRHPSEIAASLKRRDKLDEVLGELIWSRHMIEAEAATRDHPRIWTSYDRLLANWRDVAAAIAAGLDVLWPHAPALAAPEIDAFLAPSLRHFDASRQPADYVSGPAAMQIWRAALLGLAGNETGLRKAFDQITGVSGPADPIERPA